MTSDPSPPTQPSETEAPTIGDAVDSRHLRALAWFGLVIGAMAAFWPLLSFDPQENVTRPIAGFEGTLFQPSGEDPRLILVLAAWMLFSRRGRIASGWLAGEGRTAAGVGLGIAAIAVAAWSTFTSSPDLQVHALQLALLAGGVGVAGRSGLRAVRGPALFLFLALPIPAVALNQILFPLQMFTVQACTAILHGLGFEAAGVGDQIFTPRGVFHVIETCSGLRLIQTLVMTAVVYSELFGRTTRRTLALLVAAPLVAIAVNLARVLSIIFNPAASISTVHTTQGVFMVVIGVLGLAAIDRAIERVRPGRRRSAGPRAPLLQVPLDARFAAITVGVFALIAAVWLTPKWTAEVEAPVALRLMPRELGVRRSNGVPVDLEYLGSVHFSDRIQRVYGTGDAISRPLRPGETQVRPFRVFLGEDDRLNRRGSPLSGKTAVPGRAWQQLARSRVDLTPNIEADYGFFMGPQGRRVTLHWRAGFGPLWIEISRAWLGLDRSPWRREGAARVWRVGAEVEPEEDVLEVSEELLNFARVAQRAWQELETNARSDPGTPHAEAGSDR